eukprot:TRINITY_DN83565_c0_g1_i1.p2 TRINITY_DN83565_c0_g1~~TRINITY_DN83565_c0_g1_i1.p2  ORF type:complete len:104 (+),score=40.12 TRINITY_DN83565_c0_g1_i1:47-358(+)
MVKQIKSAQEFHEVIKSGKLVVIDWFATWCGPCKAISPYVEELQKEHGDVEFFKVDVDELEDLSREAGIQAMPTFQFYKNGAKVDEFKGANRGTLKDTIAKHK